MALPKNITELVKELHKTYQGSQATNKQDRVKSLELALAEQRRDWDALNQAYEAAKRKNITFLAAAFALLGYLYASNIQPHESLKDKLFIPSEPYGVIIYALGAGLYLFAIAALMFALRSRSWSTAYENDQEDSRFDDYEKYLQYMQKRYLQCSHNNLSSYNAKYSLLEMSFLPLVLGGTLLLILKIFA